MAEIVIDSEFANLCRALTAEEKSQLEANLKADGCIDPLRMWGDTLLDGHNRYEMCVRLGLPFKTEQVEIADRASALNWVIANQLGRRNLIPEDVSYLRGKRYEIEKTNPKDHQKRFSAAGTAMAAIARSDKPEVHRRYQNDRRGEPSVDTAVRLAKELDVGTMTIRRDAKFSVAVDKIQAQLGNDTAALIRTGKSGLTKAAVCKFADTEDMTMDKFNNARMESINRRRRDKKTNKRTAPKAPPPLTALQRSRTDVSTLAVERMRQFTNAIEQIATIPVVARSLAFERWSKGFHQRVHHALPLAMAYLHDFAEAFSNTEEPSNGD